MSLLDKASFSLTPNAYKAGKLYSIIPTSGNGDLTFTRATSGSRVNSSGLIETVATGVPRLNYSGSTASWLLEPQRTNLAAYSTQFDNAYWSKNNSTISSNLITAPDGTTTADKIVSNLFTGRVSVNKTFTVTANAKNTFTLYAKAAEWSKICIFHDAATFTEAAYYGSSTYIDLLTGTSTSSSIAKATPVGNDWYRIETSATPSATTHSISIVPLDPLATSVNGVNGDGVSGVYIWGAQFESSASYATSYIPTTTSTVTRNVDSITKTNLYTNNFITSAGGTWFTELNNNFSLTRDAFGYGLFLNTLNNSSGNGFNFRNGSANTRLRINKTISGVDTELYLTLTDILKVAIKWNGTTADVFVNGVKIITSTSFTTTAMEFLNTRNSDVPKYIKSLILFPTPLTDTECISLTTL